LATFLFSQSYFATQTLRTKFGRANSVAHHQFAVVKRWANQDRPKIIFADSGQLASQEPACEMML
jgi:hypothetical protein